MTEAWHDLKVLLAGCGSIGKRHARVLAALNVGRIQVCDPNPEQVRALQAEVPGVEVVPSYELGLARNPNAVFVLTPPGLHLPMIFRALDAGCHVFTEKPLSDSMTGVAELTARVSASEHQVMVGLCFRYHEGLLKAKRMLECGTIGRLVSVRALMGEHLPEVRPDYRNLFSAKKGGAFDLMHDIDLALWAVEPPVTAVKCIFGNFSDIGIEAPDTVEILIGFADRCVASVHLDFFQRPRRRQLELIGTDGVITVEFASWDQCTLATYRPATGNWELETIPTRRDDMFEAEDREFLTAVTGGKCVACDVPEAAKSLAVVTAAQATGLGRSLRERIRRVRMVAFDFDGVFTDNRVHVNQNGIEAVSCWRSDGFGLQKLQKLDIETVIVSSEVNPVVTARGRKHDIRCIQAVEDKLAVLREIAAEAGLSMNQIAFVGNDINDKEALGAVGLPIIVQDAHPDVRQYAAYRTKAPGGRGAVREVCDLIADILSRES